MQEIRARNANILRKELADLEGFALQETYKGATHGWHIAAGRTDKKDFPVAKGI